MTGSSFKSPLIDLPSWAVVYGEHDIVLGYAESEEEATKAADALNVQAPQYNHRAKRLI